MVIKPVLTRYLRKARWFRYGGLRLKIYPGAFHPAFFFSTRFFAEFIEGLDLTNKAVCEVGAGSGLLSFVAFSKGASLCSFDINPTAVTGLAENLRNNFKVTEGFRIYRSDLFDDIPTRHFDVFIISPPYFFSDPQDDGAYAWYCGKNGEYFEKLFRQIGGYTKASSQIFMLLAENCDLQRISAIAAKYHYSLDLCLEKKIKWERNFIFRISEESDPGL
jgi:release factor glutamine methyltransferase